MEHWIFLIQKAGDRSWLPLESPTVEILEGRYRVSARSSYPDTPVDIEIIHQYELDGIPRQQFQQQSQQTDGEGMIEAMPFTYLQPGLWKLSCFESPSSEPNSIARSCRKSIQLQVLAQDSEGLADWELVNEPASNTPIDPILASNSSLTGINYGINRPSMAGNAREAQPHIPDPQPVRTKTSLKSPVLPTFTHPVEPMRLRISEGPTLPPQLHASSASQVAHKKPQLPVFPGHNNASSPKSDVEVRRHQPRTGEALPASPVDTEFEALKLRKRFWLTLNSLAKEVEWTEQREQEIEWTEQREREVQLTEQLEQLIELTEQPELHSMPQLEESRPQSITGLQSEADKLQNPYLTEAKIYPSQEKAPQLDFSSIKIELPNELSKEPTQRMIELPELTLEQPSHLSSQLAMSAEPPLVTEPLPIPQLVVPEGALVAGKPITVYVRLPEFSVPMIVKLRVKDRQNSDLLDGWRSLVDFSPNKQLNVLEASTQVTIPLESQEVTFVAIAVDINTQQQSPKVRLNRWVISPGLPSTDTFEV